MNDILIIYYSRTGKARMVAEKLAGLLGADIEEIREEKSRAGRLAWFVGIKDSLFDKPAEITSKHSVGPRKVVVIGMPVWASSPPPAVRTFIQTCDLAGKTVYAFCTHDGGGGKGAFAKTAELVGGELASTLALKKPKPDDPELDEKLQQWADEIKVACE